MKNMSMKGSAAVAILMTIATTMAVTTPSMGAAAQASELEQVLQQRLAGDRSGVCVAAVRVDDEVEQATFCADQSRARTLGPDSRFEIGSVSKTFLGLLAARLIESGRVGLQQPVSELLPEGTSVPDYDGEPIRIIHLLTHSSGLPRIPSNMKIPDQANPYASYTPADLLDDLAQTEPGAAPGDKFEYSNSGFMLLSFALSHHMGEPLALLFEREVFQPLGMSQTAMDGPTVPGHAARDAVSNWDFHPDLGGVGAIRSTPSDMARWLNAVLRGQDGPLSSALARSREVLLEIDGEHLGYGWIHMPLGERRVMAHDGGTGGFSSFVVVDPDQGRASLVLMDTSMILYGSLSDLALHLVDSQVPLSPPNLAVAIADGVDLNDYTGRFALFDGDEPFMGDFVLDFTADDAALLLQASVGGQVQPRLPMDPDGEDRFVITELDLVIEFQRESSSPIQHLDFRQGPLKLRGERL
jgi:serine-type D-Ala-D-Ala carboxypeptidase/endopeptidase